MSKLSPLAPFNFPKLHPVKGVRLATYACEIRYKNRDDVLLVELVGGTRVAGVFTKSLTRAAPVLWCQKQIKHGVARALLVNSGNANAFSGIKGVQAVERTVGSLAKALGCHAQEVFIASTGTIGVPLPDKKITDRLTSMVGNLSDSNWNEAAKAIMTTDTFAKGVSKTIDIAGVKVTLTGIAKGSGMIAPDMATMLAFIFTDANISVDLLQSLLKKGTDKSFNNITVDSDTSTSDTLLLFATGLAPHKPITKTSDYGYRSFKQALDEILLDLAHQVVKDGEGATKFVEIKVSGATTHKAAKVVGLAIANSPLVKTAIAGEDANWGRIVMAVGKAGVVADRDRLSIKIGGIAVAKAGQPIDNYDERPVSEHMKGSNILIEVDLGLAKGSSTVWTCDLTHGYIDINASYRS